MLRISLLLVAAILTSSIAAADDPKPTPPGQKASAKRIVVKPKTIELPEPIYFEFGKPVIKAQSFGVLDALVATLASDPKLGLIEVQGHTDERGDDAYNLEISTRRAEAIVKYLVDKGINPKRLRAVGYGETQPLDRGHNEKAWAKNRRIAFLILQRIT